MKSIKRLVLSGMLAISTAISGFAQVQDISITLSPYASYMWWNENIALTNSPFVGGRVGVGFGPFFELRGTFEKSLNLKNALEGKNWNPFTPEQLQKLEGMNIDVTRFGGEVKVNLLNGFVLAPYITLGGGVQVLDYNPFDHTLPNFVNEAKQKEKQLFLSGGVGLKVSLTDRVALTFEGKNVRFNMDANNSFLNPTVKEETKRWGNWSALASLDFYLGGSTRERTKYSDLYNDGFRGMKFVLEPGVLYTNFNDGMMRPDQWFLGGSAGFDFSSLIGIRAFYYQATREPNKLSFNFNDDLRMYGANLIARLNYPRGIVPYLQFGAGYLDDNNFIATGSKQAFKTHNLFALFGAGLEIPLSRYVALFGTANAMLMSDRGLDIAQLNKPSDITTNYTFTGGIRFNIGKPAYVSTPAATLTEEEMEELNESREVPDKSERRSVSEERRSETRATLFGDNVRRSQEKERGEMMTKKEFEEMVDRILQKIRAEEQTRASQFSQSEMDVIIAALRSQNPQEANQQATATSNEQVILELRRLVDRLDNQSSTPQTTHIYTQPGYGQPVVPQSHVAPVRRVDPVAIQSGQPTVARTEFMKLNRIAGVTGVNFGEGTQWMLGIRGYLQISDTPLDFVPELMVGFGKKSAFDLSGNVVYNIPVELSGLKPYVGLGLGIFSHGMGGKFLSNVILGTNYKLGNSGELFADYSVRGLFRNNQISVGYRFVF